MVESSNKNPEKRQFLSKLFASTFVVYKTLVERSRFHHICFLFSVVVLSPTFFIANMNSGFASSLTPAAAHVLSLEYEEISFVNFIAGDDTEDRKLYLVYIHGKRSTEPIKYKMPSGSKSNIAYKQRLLPLTYDRFFLFGDPASNRVLALFSSNEKESRILTRYHNLIKPGQVVVIIEPRITGTMVDSQNVLITTSNPILAVPETECTLTFNEMPPYDIESETDIKFFHFITKDLKLKFVTPTTD